MDGGDQLETLREGGKRSHRRHCFQLVFGAVAGKEASLSQGVIKAGLFRLLRQPLVVFKRAVSPLRELGDNQSPADVGHPIGKANVHVRSSSRWYRVAVPIW